ncbi:MAG: DUF364 domain-containing protein [Thermodesulfobacteriota bacterium]|nr:DUF364 domain-containing protein [Thermodesulfobacteriota bacterium]
METSVLENSKIQLAEIVATNRLLDAHVSVLVKTLTPQEAIGEPGRRNFPIILGKERVIEAEILGTKAHAFTDSPGEFMGDLKGVLNLPLTSNRERSIYVATLSATLKYLNLIENTIHCKDEDPERCGKEIASQLLKKWGKVKVGFIGLNPAIAENLIETFGIENVRITDLNKQNIHSFKCGVKIWDGNEMTEELIKQSDVILVTGTTFVNRTFDHIMHCVQNYRKDYLIYGVTGAGICKLLGLNRICPYSRNQ